MSKRPIDDVHGEELYACKEGILDDFREENLLFATAVLHDNDKQ